MDLKEYINNVHESLLQEASSLLSFYKMQEANAEINISRDKVKIDGKKINRAVVRSEIGIALVFIDKGDERYLLEITLDEKMNFT